MKWYEYAIWIVFAFGIVVSMIDHKSRVGEDLKAMVQKYDNRNQP